MNSSNNYLAIPAAVAIIAMLIIFGTTFYYNNKVEANSVLKDAPSAIVTDQQP